MSLPELFHHQHRFIGALGMRRQRRLQAGDRLGAGTLDTADANDYAALAARILYPLTGRGEDLVLQTQAITSPVLHRCPALQDDGLCQIHTDRKPSMCSAVPLDPLLPDSLQQYVLAARGPGGAEYLGADCVTPTQTNTFQLQTQGKVVVDPAAREALDARRQDLALDKHWWGTAVCAELHAQILQPGGSLAQIPVSGVVTLPLAPVLLIVAGASVRCRERCKIYVAAQQTLIASQIEHALLRKNPAERTFTTQLRHIAATLGKLQAALPHITPAHFLDTNGIERWLGISPHP